MDDELDVAIGTFHFPDGKPCITAVLSFHASSRSARRRFRRRHNTSDRHFVASRMCRSLGVSGLGGILNPILLLVGVFVLGLGFAVNAPVWASLVPQLVTDDELPSALTLGGVQLNISGILGPALAGILLSKLEAPFVFALNAAGFLLVFLAIPALPRSLRLRQHIAEFRSFDFDFRSLRRTD